MNPSVAQPRATDWIERAKSLTVHVRDFIGGRWIDTQGDPIEKWAPRDGQLLYRFGSGSQDQVNAAVAQARSAFEDGRWSRRPIQSRKEILYRFAALLERHREELALLECLDTGKPIHDVLTYDIPAAVAIVRFNVEAADKFYGKVYGADPHNLTYELLRPLGVVAGIVGWNFPLFLAAMKIAPVLVTGNSLILKPSELTSLSAARVAELATEAGVPEGIFNVIHGDGKVGEGLARHAEINAVSFTGSSHTGKKLLIASGESNMERLVLECGGKSPHIVFEDCPDLEAAADAIVTRAFWNQGQVCTASSRLLVQESIQDELLSILATRVATLVPGDPLDIETRFGALVSAGHKRKVEQYIASGKQDGARILQTSQPAAPFADGFYVPPLIFDQVQSKHRIAQEEIFGPVLSVISFVDEVEAMRIANDTIYGLSAILWTQDLARAHRVSYGISAGWIVVNATKKPAGGPGIGLQSVGGHKQSGLGTEGGLEGLAHYTSSTAVQFFV